jgi:hypothetical protein
MGFSPCGMLLRISTGLGPRPQQNAGARLIFILRYFGPAEAAAFLSTF